MSNLRPAPEPHDDFDLEQYRALRGEIIQSMDDANQIMGFGLAGIGLIVNAGIGVRSLFLGFLIFATLLPLVCALVLSMWFAAQERTARASYFLSGLEPGLSCSTGRTLTWELWLRTSNAQGDSRHFWSTEYAAIGLLTLIATVSLIFSFGVGGDDLGTPARLAVISTSVLAAASVGLSIRRRFARWQYWLSTVRNPARE